MSAPKGETITVAQPAELPKSDNATLSLSCTAVGVPGTLGDWISRALAILLDPAAYAREQILEVKDALAAFGQS